MKCKLLSVFTAAVLAVNIMPCISADAENERISSDKDLLKFLDSCTGDSFSKGKDFVLTADIDLGGKTIDGAPVFCGSFDGGGHTVKNYKIAFTGDDYTGFFNKIAEGAAVVNLSLNGTMEKKASKDDEFSADAIRSELEKNLGITTESTAADSASFGGVAGYNEGVIKNCAYSGTIQAEKRAGGIAGENSEKGLIDTCVNYAEISSTYISGGIVGDNEGRVRDSENKGAVCVDAEENTGNIGGIAGFNEGVVENGVNSADVGETGFGTNIGGIAGKQCGVISECENTAAVGGNKNVGGITGIFVPYIDYDLSAENIKKETDKTKQAIKDGANEIQKDVDSSVDNLFSGFGDFSKLLSANGLTGLIPSALFSAASGNSKVKDGAARVINGIAEGIEQRNANSESISDSLNDILGSVNNKINGSGVDSAAISDNINEILGSLNNNINNSGLDGAAISQSITDALYGINDSVSSLSDETMNDFEDVKNSAQALTDSVASAVDGTARTNAQINELLGSLDSAVDTFSRDEAARSGALVDKVNDIDFDDIDKLSDSITDMTNSTERFLRDAERDLGDTADTVTEPFERLDDMLHDVQKDVNDTKDKADKVKDDLHSLTDNLPTPHPFHTMRPLPSIIPLPTVPPKSDKSASSNSKDSLTGMLPDIFITAHAQESERSGIKEIIDTDAIKDALKSMVSVDVSLSRTIAGEEADNALIKYCLNSGKVSGSDNVGGVAGSMGIESLIEEGESVKLPDGKPLMADMSAKAVIDGSVNSGGISAKNNRAGGIAGDSSIGIIKNCLGSGDAECENGGYVGCIGGDTRASILYSIGISHLKGKNNVGGIAGTADNIEYCYALPLINGDAQKKGYIAGAVNNTAKNNYFIDEGTGGIDGASEQGKAEAKAASEMVGTGEFPAGMTGLGADDWYMEKGDKYLPQIKALAENEAKGPIKQKLAAASKDAALFRFTVRFIADGEELAKLTKEYGETLAAAEIPEPPAKDGSYPEWDGDTSEPILRNTVFTAEYTDAVTTIASEGSPALLLIEGNFSDETKVSAEETSFDADFGSKYEVIGEYEFSVTPESDIKDGFTMRVYDKGKTGTHIGIVQNGMPRVIEGERDGKYLKCLMQSPGQFALLSVKKHSPVPFIAGAAIIIAAACVFILMRKRKLFRRKIR